MQLHVQDHIAHLQLSQPQSLNTMHPGFWRDLDAALAHIQAHGDVRALVISSTGKHFSAGMALETFANPEFAPQDKSPEGRAARQSSCGTCSRFLPASSNCVFLLSRPSKVAALAVHWTWCAAPASATPRKKLFSAYRKSISAWAADLGSLQRLPKLLPMGLVKELAYTGRRWPAQAALEHGFVNGLDATQEDMLAAAMQTAQEIASKPPIAIWGSKQALDFARDHSVQDSLRQMGWLQAGIWSNRHVMESVQASKQQRAGDFPALMPQRAFGQM